jgi:hypothetical protein
VDQITTTGATAKWAKVTDDFDEYDLAMNPNPTTLSLAPFPILAAAASPEVSLKIAWHPALLSRDE